MFGLPCLVGAREGVGGGDVGGKGGRRVSGGGSSREVNLYRLQAHECYILWYISHPFRRLFMKR